MMETEKKQRKAVLRAQKRQERNCLSEQEREEASEKICENLQKHPLVQAAQYFYCYAPVQSEADIRPLCIQLLESGKNVAFPRVSGDSMEFYQIFDLSELTEGSFHVMEPVDDGRPPVDWESALVLVPGLVFDEQGARCGYGRGYYDRYFAAHPALIGIGIAFECQLSGQLAECCEPTDHRLDGVMTQKGMYSLIHQITRDELVALIGRTKLFGSAPGIESFGAAMEFLGHPQKSLSFLHIAGTNGKGSVAAYLREICVGAGIRTGLFTSPHLVRFEERIQVDHTLIPESDLVRLGRRMLEVGQLVWVKHQISLTMFDYCLGIALLYFAKQGVKLVILETGMGGRLDATNIIPAPVVSVITAIGLEHTRYLGSTISRIATEKAGILKTGTKAVLMQQSDEALTVLRQVCEERQISYRISGCIDQSGRYRGRHYEVGMPGSYQRQNAAAAIEAALLLQENGFAAINDDGIAEAIASCRWPGRMEIVSEKPWVILDGAHNVHGMTAFVNSLREMRRGEKYIFFIGIMTDKEYGAMIDLILPVAKQIYTLTPDRPTAVQAQDLAQIVMQKGGQACVCQSAARAVEIIRGLPENEAAVVCGSLYLLGEIKRYL